LRDSLVSEAEDGAGSGAAGCGSIGAKALQLRHLRRALCRFPKYPEALKMFADPRHLIGMAFTTLLLSLGAAVLVQRAEPVAAASPEDRRGGRRAAQGAGNRRDQQLEMWD